MPNFGEESNSTAIAHPKLRIRSAKRMRELAKQFRAGNIVFTIVGRSGNPKKISLQWANILDTAADRLSPSSEVPYPEECIISARRLLKLARRVRPFGDQAGVRFRDNDTQERHDKEANRITVAVQRLLADVPDDLVEQIEDASDE